MKQKLLLTSQGILPELREVFLKCLIKNPSKIAVAFVTTGAYYEGKIPFWLEDYREQLRQCGIKDIRDLNLEDKRQEDLELALAEVDLIFVNGGSTFYLLQHIRKSGFDKILPKLLSKGIIYVGISAGSYIACPTIEAATWKHQETNNFGIKDLTALNLVPFLITAHFEEKYRSIVEKAAQSTNYPIVALCDTQAVYVKGKTYCIVGKGKREFFNGFHEKRDGIAKIRASEP